MKTNFEIIRKSKGLTQVAVAKQLKITQATLSSYETERTEPTIEILCLMSKLYDVTIDELVGNCKLNTKNDLIIPTEKRKTIELLVRLPTIYYANIEGQILAYAKVANLR